MRKGKVSKKGWMDGQVDWGRKRKKERKEGGRKVGIKRGNFQVIHPFSLRFFLPPSLPSSLPPSFFHSLPCGVIFCPQRFFCPYIVSLLNPNCLLVCLQSARNEFLGVLAMMVRQFDHVTFCDMKVLLDNDPEADFFENIKHIQVNCAVALVLFLSLCILLLFLLLSLSMLLGCCIIPSYMSQPCTSSNVPCSEVTETRNWKLAECLHNYNGSFPIHISFLLYPFYTPLLYFTLLSLKLLHSPLRSSRSFLDGSVQE